MSIGTIKHSDLTGSDLHIPKVHAFSHLVGGSDPIEGLGSVWGRITGTLADQIDLMTALGLKSDTSHNHSLSSLSERSYNSLTDKPNLTVYLTAETDPIFSAWDKKTGISITKSQISDFGSPLYSISGLNVSLLVNDSAYITVAALLGYATQTWVNNQGFLKTYNEIDPVFSAWDKSTGITITESQITDFQDYLSDVDVASPAKNQTILYNGSRWVNAAQGTSFIFSIATFTCTGGASGTVFEIGSGTWKATGAISFSATYNNGPATGGYVVHSGWSNLTLTGTGYVGPTSNISAVSYPASPGSTKIFQLNATDGTDTSTNTITYTFNNRRFWGVSTVASGYSEANIEALTNELSNSRVKTFTVVPGANEYIVYAYPSRLGTATFTVGGFEGGFQAPETVSVTNASGYSETYFVYRSTNANLGSTSTVVS